MKSIFKEYNSLNLTKTHNQILDYWDKNDVFKKSISSKKEKPVFTFYEGPPSANGMPGIHHVIARSIKDLFCRYKTLKGFHVDRKAGWDTHGLPVELGVEKELNITKEDIGKSISIEEYNNKCKHNVMRFQKKWEEVTRKMGYWVDMKNPYVTYNNKYIESVWWLLAQFHQKGLLYKGHTIQPYSPKAGTGLSTHELNQPGCYKNIKDNTVVAQFSLIKNKNSDFIFKKTKCDVFFLAWTTTPWTLPSNTALAVGKNINYVLVETINKYSNKSIAVIIAKDLYYNFFKTHENSSCFDSYEKGSKNIPHKIVGEFKGSSLEGLDYDQLLKYKKPEKGLCFKVLSADFVTTQDGTGIVHLAPSFGSDDSKVAKQNGFGSLTLVDKQGRFTEEVIDFKGIYVKQEYYTEKERPKLSADVQIIIKLKELDLCFHAEKYEHSYPHCWRTDKPILYYPMDSWFVKTTKLKNKMTELNRSINWKPVSTGEGRFGKWLENLVDWNLSRSRFWGIPIPIWRTEDGKHEICIGSVKELKHEIEKSITAGFMKKNPLSNYIFNDMSNENYDSFDLHRPYVDEIILVSETGEPMKRELDLIDVWFDSGAMPYAQIHYPFENKTNFDKKFPADFIAEGVDQTRGWFFTLHAISSMLFDSVAYKNVISNGLVLDKNGNKMSKRLNNAVDPFKILEKFGADATRWYMISNAQPWDNLKFDESGIIEVQRKFFGTLYNTYSFFALYANIDGFNYSEQKITLERRSELDRWVLSELNSLIKKVEQSYDDYEPTNAARLIQDFVIDKLSNWYVRLSRRRFWKGEYNDDKISAFQTLFECLDIVSRLGSPIAPFYMDQLYQDLNVIKSKSLDSVHLSVFPKCCEEAIDLNLERVNRLAQKITSLALSLRKKEGIRVRQPLQKLIIPVLNQQIKKDIIKIEELLKNELNIKEVECLTEESQSIKKQIKPNFRTLGPDFGKNLKLVVNKISKFSQKDISEIEEKGVYIINNDIKINLSHVIISSLDVPGFVVANNEGLTVALDIKINDELKGEGLAREFVNRIQNLRKEKKLDVTDNIRVFVSKNKTLSLSIQNNLAYICEETLASELNYDSDLIKNPHEIQLVDNISVKVSIEKI